MLTTEKAHDAYRWRIDFDTLCKYDEKKIAALLYKVPEVCRGQKSLEFLSKMYDEDKNKFYSITPDNLSKEWDNYDFKKGFSKRSDFTDQEKAAMTSEEALKAFDHNPYQDSCIVKALERLKKNFGDIASKIEHVIKGDNPMRDCDKLVALMRFAIASLQNLLSSMMH